MLYALPFSLVVLGITSIVGQVVMLRELMIVFYGNEFFVGWSLFSWLFWTGIGSMLFGMIFRSGFRFNRQLVLFHILVALLIPIEIALVRVSRLAVGSVPGEVPNLLPSLLYVFVALAPLCLILGGQFVAAARAWTDPQSSTDTPALNRILGRSYAFETTGFFIGGFLFSLWLVLMNEFAAACLLAGLNLLAGGIIMIRTRERGTLSFLWALALISAAGSGFFSGRLNLVTSAFRFPHQDLVSSHNSIYGNIAVTRLGNQFSFYENGLFLSADHDEMSNEYLVHIPLLYHPNPKRILLVGGGFNGALAEILKHNPESIDYVELDAELIATARRYLPPDLEGFLDNHKVRLINLDGRFFLKQAAAGNLYDVVIVNLPNPGTILINRYYTEEFFREIKSHLKSDGIFSIHLAFSPDYLSRELNLLGSSIFKAMQPVFKSVILLPESTLFFLASPEAELNYDSRPLIQRLAARNLKMDFVTPNYIDYRLTTDRIPAISRAFQDNITAVPNRDFRPAACFYNFLNWVSSFQPAAARLLGRMGNPWWIAAAGILAIIFFTAFIGRPARRPANLAISAMTIGSFTLMAVEIILIVTYQVYFGYLFHRIALLIGAIMFGMAVGTGAATRLANWPRLTTLGIIHAGILLHVFFFMFFLQNIAIIPSSFQRAVEGVFLIFSILIGILVGFEYPVANRIYLEGHEGSAAGKAGVIYGIDLLGSCLGALLISMWILPVWGVLKTLNGLTLLNTLVLVLIFIGAVTSRPARNQNS